MKSTPCPDVTPRGRSPAFAFARQSVVIERRPVNRYAEICISSRIVVPSAWDSSVVILLLLETMIAEVQKQTWDDTRHRIEDLEDIFDRTRFFRKFN